MPDTQALDLTEGDVREPISQAVEQIASIAETKQVPLNVHLPNMEVLACVDGKTHLPYCT